MMEIFFRPDIMLVYFTRFAILFFGMPLNAQFFFLIGITFLQCAIMGFYSLFMIAISLYIKENCQLNEYTLKMRDYNLIYGIERWWNIYCISS